MLVFRLTDKGNASKPDTAASFTVLAVERGTLDTLWCDVIFPVSTLSGHSS